MCGIAGFINNKNKENIGKVLESLQHRGPDAQNFNIIDNVTLLHTRLSIQDLAHGTQPMKYKQYNIVFNGEIYNHIELRQKHNLLCKTSSDTETLLCLYDKLGLKCLDKLDGMFAFAIYDSKKQNLILARDRSGKKPLYLYQQDDKLIFASELNAIKEIIDTEVNEVNIAKYLRAGMLYNIDTPYKNIQEIDAGSYSIIDTTTLEIKSTKWWNILDFYNKPKHITYTDAKVTLDNLLHKSVKNRLDSSDLEVGTFLSGGIDSGLVTAIASQYKDKLKTYTVSFDGEYDEAPLAKLVSQKYNTEHTEIRINFDNLQDDIESILLNYGEPFADSSAIPSYYVSKEAKKHLTVILNGDGADELFGGYRRYVPYAKYDFFNSNTIVKNFAYSVSSLLPIPKKRKSNYNYIYRMINFASKSNVGQYFSTSSNFFENFETNIINKKYLDDISKKVDFIGTSQLSGLQKIMALDFDIALKNDLLVKMDIASMVNSLEGRSPFLSKDILEFAPTIHDSFKIQGTNTKRILRDLAIDYLPEQLINQPKRGFEIPLIKWVDDNLRDIIFSYLDNKNNYSQNFIDKTFLDKLLYKKVRISDEQRVKILWSLFSLEVWHKNL